jgi:hypothetical protein
MIVQLLAALLALAGLFLLVRSLWLRSGLSRRQTWLTAGAALIIVLLIGLAATGRLHWLVAAGAALLPFLRRALGLLRVVPLINQLFPGWQQRYRRQSQGVGQGTAQGGGHAGTDYATTETAHLRMSLHQASGHIDGEVLAGAHQGRLLSELSQAEIVGLHGAFNDQDSKRLLETYLDRTWSDWRTANAGTGHPAPDSAMDRRHALEVLGLDDTASEQDIIDAHRRLMQKLHPDRGGSNYLAATLNEAKKTLLDA